MSIDLSTIDCNAITAYSCPSLAHDGQHETLWIKAGAVAVGFGVAIVDRRLVIDAPPGMPACWQANLIRIVNEVLDPTLKRMLRNEWT